MSMDIDCYDTYQCDENCDDCPICNEEEEETARWLDEIAASQINRGEE